MYRVNLKFQLHCVAGEHDVIHVVQPVNADADTTAHRRRRARVTRVQSTDSAEESVDTDAAMHRQRLAAAARRRRRAASPTTAAARRQRHAAAEAARRAGRPPTVAAAQREQHAAAEAARRANRPSEVATAQREQHAAAEAARRADYPPELAAAQREQHAAAEVARYATRPPDVVTAQREQRAIHYRADRQAENRQRLTEGITDDAAFRRVMQCVGTLGPGAPHLSCEEVLCGPGGAVADQRTIPLGSGGLTASVQLAVALQAAHRRMASVMASVVCCSCACYRPASECTPRPWPTLQAYFELLRLDIMWTEEVPRHGLTVWERLLASGEEWQPPPRQPLAEGEHRDDRRRRGGERAAAREPAAEAALEEDVIPSDSDEGTVLDEYNRRQQQDMQAAEEEAELEALQAEDAECQAAAGRRPTPEHQQARLVRPRLDSPQPPPPPPPTSVRYAARILGPTAQHLQNAWFDEHGQPAALRVCDACLRPLAGGRWLTCTMGCFYNLLLNHSCLLLLNYVLCFLVTRMTYH